MNRSRQITVLEESVEIIGIREQLNKPKFNRVEFEAVKNEAGRNLAKINYRIHHGCKCRVD